MLKQKTESTKHTVFLLLKYIPFLLLIPVSILLLSSGITALELSDKSEQERKDILPRTGSPQKSTSEIPKSTSFIEYHSDIKNRELLIQNAEAEIARFGGHMQGYAELIVDRAIECGGDPVLLLAIAGNESGYGKIPYKEFNPFGYLNNAQYASWEEALYILSCKISEHHLVPCDNDIYCVIERYGGPETDKPQWIRNVSWLMNQL